MYVVSISFMANRWARKPGDRQVTVLGRVVDEEDNIPLNRCSDVSGEKYKLSCIPEDDPSAGRLMGEARLTIEYLKQRGIRLENLQMTYNVRTES